MTTPATEMGIEPLVERRVALALYECDGGSPDEFEDETTTTRPAYLALARSAIAAYEATRTPEAAQWQPIETAPKDGTPIILSVRGHHPERPNANGQFVTVGCWSWSPDARLPHEEYPDDGGFLELNNNWRDGWGGNIGDRYWQPLPEPPALAQVRHPSGER